MQKQKSKKSIAPQVTKEELSGMSKEEILKIIFDKSVTKIKEGGHAKYARS